MTADLAADCARCVGLCCVALPLSRSADFPVDKPAGQPCTHLRSDHGCGIHDRLRAEGWAGCATFDCFGAGQRVTQTTYGGMSWRDEPSLAPQMYAVFEVVRRLHEMLELLDQARALAPSPDLWAQATELRGRVDDAAGATPSVVLTTDLPALHAECSDLFRRVSSGVRPDGAPVLEVDLVGSDLSGRDLRGCDLRGRLLLGADLSLADLRGADLLGADLRAARLHGADLTGALFLTGPQLAAASGDPRTTVDPRLSRPATWSG